MSWCAPVASEHAFLGDVLPQVAPSFRVLMLADESLTSSLVPVPPVGNSRGGSFPFSMASSTVSWDWSGHSFLGTWFSFSLSTSCTIRSLFLCTTFSFPVFVLVIMYTGISSTLQSITWYNYLLHLSCSFSLPITTSFLRSTKSPRASCAAFHFLS